MSASFLRQRTAIAAMFFVNGTLFATWVSRIPVIKEALELSEARLGLALLAMGSGTLSALPLTSWLIARFGSRPLVSSSAFVCCAAVVLAGRAPSFASLAAALALFGAALGSMDVAMNAQAALLGRRLRRSIMSSFHGLWSLGGLIGASLGSGFAARGYGPSAHFLAVSVALALTALAAARALIPDGEQSHAPSPLALPSRALLAIGFVGSCGAVIEGGIAEWSGVYLREALGASAAFAASGFAAFSLAMMVGRFLGDRWIDRFGRVALLRNGSTLTGVAIAAALISAKPHVAVTAFVLAGLGMSTVFPIAFGAAGSLRGHAPGHAIAAVATMAYGAGLIGPPVIGFVASATSLTIALGLLVLASVTIAALAGRLVPASRMREAELRLPAADAGGN